MRFSEFIVAYLLVYPMYMVIADVGLGPIFWMIKKRFGECSVQEIINKEVDNELENLADSKHEVLRLVGIRIIFILLWPIMLPLGFYDLLISPLKKKEES